MDETKNDSKTSQKSQKKPATTSQPNADIAADSSYSVTPAHCAFLSLLVTICVIMGLFASHRLWLPSFSHWLSLQSTAASSSSSWRSNELRDMRARILRIDKRINQLHSQSNATETESALTGLAAFAGRLNTKLDTLEKTVSELEPRSAVNDENLQQTMYNVIAVMALKERALAFLPYEKQLQPLLSWAEQNPAAKAQIDILQSQSNLGIASPTQINQQLDIAINALTPQEPEIEKNWQDKLLSHASQLVKVRRIDKKEKNNIKELLLATKENLKQGEWEEALITLQMLDELDSQSHGAVIKRIQQHLAVKDALAALTTLILKQWNNAAAQ